MTYAFILGNTPELSISEIESTVPFNSKQRLDNEILEISSDEIIPEKLINKLGGTVKIAQYLGDYNNNLIQYFDPPAGGSKKIEFGISQYNTNINIKKLSQELKKHLPRSRFVLPKNNILSSVVVKKQKLLELVIVKNKIFKTVAVQDFEDWNKRDYGRPAADPKAGMLPPKVARMMVNIAKVKNGTILDPFCGVGTILSEALIMGINVIGADISPKAVQFSRKNLDWIKKEYKTDNKYDILVKDAKLISLKSVDAIVTEPYMGPINPTRDTIGGIIKNLEDLYMGCFLNWRSLLKKGGSIVMAFPSFNFSGLEFSVKSPIDKLHELGYTFCRGPITYSRPQAVVKRNIYVLTKQ